MRVEVRIPGSLESYCIDERGDKRVATEALWLETFLCGILRAYSYADDGSGDTIKKIVGVRRFNPVTNTEMEHKFLDAAERLFFMGTMRSIVSCSGRTDNGVGRQLSSDPETQVPNTVSNHLTSGLLKYIRITGRYTSGINLFEKLRTRDVEVSSLLARVLIEADEEVQAVRLMHDALQDVPMDYALLDCQAAFCQSKGEGEMALECAKRAVTAAPSEFSTWARLAEVYVSLEQWDLALLTLNSCPMFTYQDKDAPRMPQPSRVILPIMAESVLDEIDEGQPKQGEPHDFVHPSLRKLHAASYQGTFLKAYNLLTKIAASIGWDQLLKIRSEVFVMEEEYRIERQNTTTKPGSKNTSTVAIHQSSSSKEGVNGNGPENGTEESSSKEEESSEKKTNGTGTENHADGSSIERPEQTVASEVVKSGNEDVSSTAVHWPRDKKLTQIRPTPPTPATRSSRTSGSASAGSTTSSWSSTRTCASTPSGARRWHSPASRPSTTRRRRRSGRFWASWPSGCTTSTRPSRPTATACRSGSPPRPCGAS